MSSLSLKYIGVINTSFEKKSGVPIQSGLGENHVGTITINPEYKDGLKDLDGFSHIHLIYHFNQHDDYSLKVKPYRDDTFRGVFATRAPKRPNPIGLSLVEIVKIKGNIIEFKGVDIINRTPLLDIKPYYNEFDSRENSKGGWLEEVNSEINNSDDRF